MLMILKDVFVPNYFLYPEDYLYALLTLNFVQNIFCVFSNLCDLNSSFKFKVIHIVRNLSMLYILKLFISFVIPDLSQPFNMILNFFWIDTVLLLKKYPLFSRLPFSMSKVTSNLDNIKTSTWSMIFYVFYSNFSLHDSLEQACSTCNPWARTQPAKL